MWRSECSGFYAAGLGRVDKGTKRLLRNVLVCGVGWKLGISLQAMWSQTAYLSVTLSSVRQARGGWFGGALRAPGGGAVFVLGVAPGAPSFVDTVVLSVPQTGQQVRAVHLFARSSAGASAI